METTTNAIAATTAVIDDADQAPHIRSIKQDKSDSHVVHFDPPSLAYQWVSVVFFSFVSNLLLASDLTSSYSRLEIPSACILKHCSQTYPPTCGLIGTDDFLFFPDNGNPVKVSYNESAYPDIDGLPEFINVMSKCYKNEQSNASKLSGRSSICSC